MLIKNMMAPPRLYRQNTHPDMWPCAVCGEDVSSHIYGLLRDVCVTCTPRFVASLPSVWLVEGANLLEDQQQLVDGKVVHGSHVSNTPPTACAKLLGAFHSTVPVWQGRPQAVLLSSASARSVVNLVGETEYTR